MNKNNFFDSKPSSVNHKNHSEDLFSFTQSLITQQELGSKLVNETERRQPPLLNQIPEFSVAEFSRHIKRIVEDAFGYIRIRGEISGCKKASSGHIYFSLKEDEAVINAVCFKNMAALIAFDLKDGLEVVLSGRITVYEGRSNYQIIVEKVEIAGIGAVIAEIEERKQRLLAQGLFDSKHKKTLPFWPAKIGVITSRSGAVIEDILHRISERCPLPVLLYHSAMQGRTASAEVIAGIEYFNSPGNAPDLIIIARGGGSFEDLLPFNDEALVRAAFASKIPIISAIGHETDHCLLDLVSDLRAPTPSAAAELATPLLSELRNKIVVLNGRLNNYINNNLELRQRDLSRAARNIVSPEVLLENLRQKILLLSKVAMNHSQHHLKNKIQQLHFVGTLPKPDFIYSEKQKELSLLTQNSSLLVENKITTGQNKINQLEKLLHSYDYKNTLRRGYAVLRNQDGGIVSNVAQIETGQQISIELSDGDIAAAVTKKQSHN